MKSPNFSFLPDENLVSLASSAELFFRTYPVVTLFLLRRFGEILAQSVAAQLGIYTSEREKQLDLLNRLSRHLPDNIEDMFHDIRKAGNDAVHGDMGNYEIALKMLQNSRNLAIWYYQSFINSNYQSLTFIPPLDPEEETNQLKQELMRLRQEAEQSRFNELKAWNKAQKEAELKSQSQEEIAQLQQQLNQLEQENSLIPEIQAELEQLQKQAQKNILLNNQIKNLQKELYELNQIKEKYEQLQQKAYQKTTTQKQKTQILMQQNAVNLISKNQKKPNSKITTTPTICLNPNCGKTINNPQNYCIFCGNHLLLRNIYQPIQFLGEGGFGKVFKALNLDALNKPCIIKQLIFNVTDSQFSQISQLFEQEAIQLELLGEHPQIPRLIAYFEEENRYYIVQQFIEGKNLSDLYDLEGSFSQEQIRDFLKQMSEILEFIHQENVIHRDIKPENIIKTKDNKYFLIDFGISKQLSNQNPTTSKMIGTEYYASPEQMSFNTKITYSSDIYSLGVTCISLLTGYFPNTVNQNKHLGKLYQDNQWNLTSFLPKKIDPNLISIIEKMVKTEPTQRYQSASHILTDLKKSSLTNSGGRIEKIKNIINKLIKELKKRPLLPITGGVIGGVISFGLIGLITSPPTTITPEPRPIDSSQIPPTEGKKITLSDTIDGYTISSNNQVEIFIMDQTGAYTIRTTREILNQLPTAPPPQTLKGRKIEIYDLKPSLINGKNIINITSPEQLTIH